MKFVVVIPARFASTRLPGKALVEIHGQPMLRHVFDRGVESGATNVIVATDDSRIAEVAEGFGATVCMTNTTHTSGTDRIAEVANAMHWGDEQIVVNLQGDEPNMPAICIRECAQLLSDEDVDVGTLASPFLSAEDFRSPNCVKVVCDDRGRALYFSRASIPFARDADAEDAARSSALHHHGIYAYRSRVLRRIVAAKRSRLEKAEELEQLRALSLGMVVHVGVPSERPGIGVDTDADLARVKDEMNFYS